MASDKIVDWEVGSVDTSGNLAIDGAVSASQITVDAINASGSMALNYGTKLTLEAKSIVTLNLPTADSGLIAGQLWSDSGTVKVSAGS